MTTTLRADSRTRDESLRPAAVAMVWAGRGMPHESIAVPGVALGEADVLVAVELATVCGSDVHTVAGHRNAPTPLVLGHEFVGRVVAIGAGGVRDVEGERLSLGDRVVCSVCVSCGACDRCTRGLPQKCRELRKYGHERIAPRWELTGGFGTHVHVRAGTAIVRVGERLTAKILAPASCATATAWAALARTEQVLARKDTVVLIAGAGLVGLTAAAMAADRGATVIVSDPSEERRAVARRFGARHAIDPGQAEGPHSLAAVRQSLLPAEIDVFIEASGSSRAVAAGIDALGVGGVAILVGSVSPGAEVRIDPERIVRGLITITGVHNYTAADLRAAVGYLRARGHAWPFAEIVGETFPLHKLDEAVERAGNGGPLRVGVDPRAVAGARWAGMRWCAQAASASGS